MVRRRRFTILGPGDPLTGRQTISAELAEADPEQVDLLLRLLTPGLGAGHAIAVEGQIVAQGPEPPMRPSPRQVQQLTEMAVQQHEYLCAELRRMREEYEQEFAQERVILRTLRQRWLERICDDQVRGEDALRFLVESARSTAKKTDSSKPSEP